MKMNKNMQKATTRYLLLFVALTALSACDKTNRSFSLLSDANSFQQAPSVVQQKIDVLWVVDNSGSMASSQANLAASFNSFITRFQSLNYDFHMAVTTTDAFRGDFSTNPDFQNAARRVRSGPLFGSGSNFYYSPDSLVPVLNGQTPNLVNTFITNATQGTNGSGDERAFSSMQAALSYSGNSDFRRPGAFLAIIILSDEDDFSANIITPIADSFYNAETNADPVVLPASAGATDLYNLYLDNRIYPVSNYKTFLDGLAGPGLYSVSTISILDTDCKTALNLQSSGRRIGRRYMQLADMTNGAKASLCGDFGQSLELISNKILELSSSFKLNREPIESSISIFVNGVQIANDPQEGWTYDASTMTVTFHNTAVPPQGATIKVSFDPAKPNI
jgi:hypothetical protein